MDTTALQAWLDRYVDAWRTYDEEAIGGLFADDAEYRYHPWDEPVRGRSEIVRTWIADRDAPGSWDARYEPWAIEGDRAVAIGVSRYLGPDGESVDREYHNVFLCRFDEDGLCRSFTELYARR